MYRYGHCTRNIVCGSALRSLGLFLLVIILAAPPSVGFSAEVAEVTVIINPINLTCPLLSTLTIAANNEDTKSGSTGLAGPGSDGVVVIIRVSGRD